MSSQKDKLDLATITVSETSTLRDALARIEAGGIQLAIVVDRDAKLVGTLSDGDIRRALLRGSSLMSSVGECVNREPRCVPVGTSDAEVLQRLKQLHLHQMLVVSADNRVVGLKLLDDLIEQPERPNTVVLMVGGLGRRLGDLTKEMPKPMLPVGGRPLLETIIANFCDQGFRQFKFAVNFMGTMIERHFGDGSKFNCQIEYLRENSPLGTAGALSLLTKEPEHPVIVSNGDLLLRFDFREMLDEHVQSGVAATMAVREFEYQVPYGVVCTEGKAFVGLQEKPVQRFLISGGVYVLSPASLRHVPKSRAFDMPSLFDAVVRAGQRAGVYRIDGYWLDIGRFADYEQAQREFPQVFARE